MCDTISFPVSTVVGIDIVHKRVHQGVYFSCFHEDSDVDIAGPLTLLLHPNGKELHLFARVDANYGFKFSIVEDPTITSSGTLLTINGHNRAHGEDSTVTAYYDTTYSGGTKLEIGRVYGSGAGITQIGGNIRPEAEWILAGDLNYVFLAEVDADNTEAAMRLEWYEKE